MSDAGSADHLALFEQVISSVEEVCSQLGPDDWDRPTDCPGWTVKDNLSHLASYEAIAAGLAEPHAEVAIDHLPHVKVGDPFAEANEREIEARRDLSGPAILDEFRNATAARLKHLKGLDEEGAARDTIRTPFGELPAKDGLPIRILDVFYHEQDIRRAVSRPGHLDGAVARFVFERMATLALPRVVAKNAKAPEGSTVVVDMAAPGRSLAVEVRDGKGIAVDPPADPTARITTDLEAFLCLMGGRKPVDELVAAGRLSFQGDEALARTVAEKASVTP